MSGPPDLSVVIPAYNEEHRLGRTMGELADATRLLGRSVEVVVVDDGSSDATRRVAGEGLTRFDSGRVIRSTPNRGKGHAVRTGMLAAAGAWRLMMDADGSTSLDEIPRFLDYTATMVPEPAIVIGSIGLPASRVTQSQPFLRPLAGKVANRMIQFLVLPGIADTQRGFKLFRADAAHDVFSRCLVDGWLFDVEALRLGRDLGFQIHELPVTWEHREDSRVDARSYVGTLRELIAITRRLGGNRSLLAPGGLDHPL